jgi:recombinational DNA repair ATPase RecF
MAECTMMEQTLKRKSGHAADDVLSELDERRRDVLLRSLENRQSFLTGCDPGQIRKVSSVSLHERRKFTTATEEV